MNHNSGSVKAILDIKYKKYINNNKNHRIVRTEKLIVRQSDARWCERSEISQLEKFSPTRLSE